MDGLDSATSADTGGEALVKDLSTHLYMAKGWMKLIGVLSIIQGILIIFTLWGILICWLPIWMGVLLTRAAGRIEMAYLNGDRTMYRESTQSLQKFFTINGVLALITVVFMGIGLLALLMAGGIGVLSSLGD